MLSKEEIEYLNDLEKALEDNDSFYWQEDMHELINMLKNKDKREQKLIEKLEEDSDYFIKGAGSYVRDEATVEQERLIAKFEYAQKILKILKGENDE